MPHYKICFLDEAGKITHALDLECDGDEHAQRVIGKHRGERALELWRDGRAIAFFLPQDQDG